MNDTILPPRGWWWEEAGTLEERGVHHPDPSTAQPIITQLYY